MNLGYAMPNQTDPPNPAIALPLQIERQWRRVGDPCRSTMGSTGMPAPSDCQTLPVALRRLGSGRYAEDDAHGTVHPAFAPPHRVADLTDHGYE